MNQTETKPTGYCPEGCACKGCGVSLVVRCPNHGWVCRGCGRRAWPDRLGYWRDIAKARDQLKAEAHA